MNRLVSSVLVIGCMCIFSLVFSLSFSPGPAQAAGRITQGGGLQWATGNTADISGRLTALGAGGGIFDTNGNNVALANGISGAGGLTKDGAGTLTLTGADAR